MKWRPMVRACVRVVVQLKDALTGWSESRRGARRSDPEVNSAVEVRGGCVGWCAVERWGVMSASCVL